MLLFAGTGKQDSKDSHHHHLLFTLLPRMGIQQYETLISSRDIQTYNSQFRSKKISSIKQTQIYVLKGQINKDYRTQNQPIF